MSPGRLGVNSFFHLQLQLQPNKTFQFQLQFQPHKNQLQLLLLNYNYFLSISDLYFIVINFAYQEYFRDIKYGFECKISL